MYVYILILRDTHKILKNIKADEQRGQREQATVSFVCLPDSLNSFLSLNLYITLISQQQPVSLPCVSLQSVSHSNSQ